MEHDKWNYDKVKRQKVVASEKRGSNYEENYKNMNKLYNHYQIPIKKRVQSYTGNVTYANTCKKHVQASEHIQRSASGSRIQE